VRVADRDGEAHVTVGDSGPGLNGEDMASAFKRFACLSARPTAGEKSTGLGLAICRALTARMGGRVWCGNHPGGGACFGFALPAVVPEPVRDTKDNVVPITHPDIAREIAFEPISVPPFVVHGEARRLG
jgi:K+-sensing histidine kinase KdpD